jgi:hypothetical protein
VTGTPSTTARATTYGGDTVVGTATAAASLTATQILQNSLTINAGSTVTILPSGSGVSSAAGTASAAANTAPLANSAGNTDSDTDPTAAIQAAIASGAISSPTGERLKNRIAAIERLQASDPGLDVSLLEDRVMAAVPSLDWPTSVSMAQSPNEASSVLLNPNSAAEDLSGADSRLSDESSDLFASNADGGGSTAAVPEPSALLLAAIGGVAIGGVAIALAALRRNRMSPVCLAPVRR